MKTNKCENKKSNLRMSKNIKTYEMPEIEKYETDHRFKSDFTKDIKNLNLFLLPY